VTYPVSVASNADQQSVRLAEGAVPWQLRGPHSGHKIGLGVPSLLEGIVLTTVKLVLTRLPRS